MGSVHACAFVPHSKRGFPLLPSLAVFLFSLLEMSVESEASFVPMAMATGDLSITLLGHLSPVRLLRTTFSQDSPPASLPNIYLEAHFLHEGHCC